ncbi:cytochrome C oxidase assembly protein [Pseudomonas saudimassiliensis]|uniref:Cytochrome c oxidase assembly protein CtaG n=1 Tax=Pseudomonas saudimassiliensis TaxID=1461581 RepID=A0A078MJD5_9PSED|nr:cytochrome c oxidase assembly protein [Pseudomonas saudimassiliensis]CEA04821.1 cytochrome C oxidase assembly protein [Pseudomonas saudimassiliensis]CEF26813.1 cytochrome C oxidase assembly protein [Pseudomonas saudimassiliensis]
MRTEGLSTASLVKRLLLLVVGMFAFGFLLVPIYDVMCQALGINGKTSGSVWEGQGQAVDEQRDVRVQFISSNAEGMRWSFGPQEEEIVLHPGEARTVNFLAHNPTDRVMVAQAIPSVAPARAAAYFHKTECFCFTQQVLQPGESIEMPVRFVVDPALPKDVRRLTLAYTLFDVTERMAASLDLAAVHSN